MCNKDIKDYKFLCVGVEFLASYFLLHTKSQQNVIVNLLCTPKIFKNPLKPGFSIRNKLLQFVSGVFGLKQDISHSEKQTYNGLLKVIGI